MYLYFHLFIFSSSAEGGSQTLNQLLLPAPPTSNGSALHAKADPKMDLLSGDDFASPKAESSLALVSVGEQQPANPVSQQNALVLFDMFSNGDSEPTSTQLTQPTNVGGQTSQLGPQGQQHQMVTPTFEQSMYPQSAGPSWNGQVAQQQQQSSASPVYGAQCSLYLDPNVFYRA